MVDRRLVRRAGTGDVGLSRRGTGSVEDDVGAVGGPGVDQRAEEGDRVVAVLERQHADPVGDARDVGRGRAGRDDGVDGERVRERRAASSAASTPP